MLHWNCFCAVPMYFSEGPSYARLSHHPIDNLGSIACFQYQTIHERL